MKHNSSIQNKDSFDQSERLFVDQIHALFRGSAFYAVASIITGFALSLAYWNLVPHKILISWFVILLIAIAVRYLILLHYQKSFRPEKAGRFANYFVAGACFEALLWGQTGLLFFPQTDIAYQLFLVVVVFGIGAGSVGPNSAYLPAAFAFFTLVMLPITVVVFSVGESIHVSLGIMLSAAFVALSYFAFTRNRDFLETLKLRIENVELIQQLQKQKDEAEQANISKSKFLAAASHDLRQPLHALSLFTSVLDESTESSKQKKIVEQIKSSVEALKNLFNALLDISRLDAGVIQVEKRDFYLQPMFDSLINDFNPLAVEKGLRIACQACAFAAHSDPTLLERILRNYLSNAIRYTDSGEVKVTCNSDGEMITINIIDAGMGIDIKDQQVIFEEFYQLNNPARDRSKGLGLGLAIVQRTAKLLNHAVSVESKLGEGSIFSISVPKAQRVEEIPRHSDANTQDEQLSASKLVVVVDDEASIRDGMQSLLQNWGYSVICAADEKTVLSLLREHGHAPDGIITDYRLSENKTGIDVIQAIHSEYNNAIPALIVTGDMSVDGLRESNSVGFELLHKPVAPIRLRAFLRHL